MVTKANRSKAAERLEKAQKRIENAKVAYKLAEEKTDSLLMRFADSPWTLAASAAALIAVVVILLL